VQLESALDELDRRAVVERPATPAGLNPGHASKETAPV
jgi:hypothetical protein